MPAVVKPMRFAHSEGQTDVCYDETGQYLLTCGSDGDIRIYQGFDDSDPMSIQAGEAVTLVTMKDKRIFATPENFAVQAFTYPEGSPDGIISRFTSTVNHICLNQSKTHLAAGSSDFVIKVVKLEDNEQKCFKGHDAPVLSVALDPKGIFMASSSCDGTVRLWQMENQTIVKTFNILPKVNDVSHLALCRIGWQPGHGKYLAVPVKNTIQFYERDTWNLSFTLNSDELKEDVSIVCWSPCGSYLASASNDGQIVTWNIAAQSLLEIVQLENKSPLCGMAWNPSGSNEIAYTDNQGQFGVIENLTTKAISKKSSLIAQENDFDIDDAMMAAAGGNDDSDDESLVATKRHRVKSSWIDDEADDDDDEDDEFKEIRKLKAQLAAPLNFDDASNDGIADTASEISVKKPIVTHVPIMPNLQAAFQPSSTPIHLMHRFMVWNSVGIIRCHTEENDLSTIEIEFHDTSTHHALHLTNHLNHTMAALSSSAALLACKSQENIPSKLMCLHFGSWDTSKEWLIDLPAKEEIEAVAVGDNWTSIATNKLQLRVFTLTGVQLHIMSIPGPVVAMSGHGSFLLVVYHAGNPLPNEQSLGFKLLDLQRQQQIIADQRLPLTKKSILSWVGFSDEGTPVTVDSLGIVRFMNNSFGGTWTQVLDTKSQLKNKSDNYWIVGLQEITKQIRCILCKGATFPATLPRPVQAVLPLELPLCEMSTEKGEKEETFMKSKLMSYSYKQAVEQGLDVDEDVAQQAETFQIQTLMKMFALACKSDREFRAFNIGELLPNQRSVSLAIRYASGIRKMNLAQRLNELARRKAEEEEAALLDEDNLLVETARSSNRSVTSVPSRVHKQRQVEENDDSDVEEMEQEDEEVEPIGNPIINSKSRTDSDRHTIFLKKKPKPSDSPSLSSSQGRSNPFKVKNSQSQKPVRNKSFFDSVEEDKKTATEAAALKNKRTPESKNDGRKKKKTAKQMTLKSPTSQKEETVKTTKKSEEKTSKKSGFTLWLEENRPLLVQENPDATDAELVKISMKQWRSLSEDDRKEWNEKAAAAGGNADEKKRKREILENNENDNKITNTVSENSTKKLKCSDNGSGSASSKLAGFAYSKS